MKFLFRKTSLAISLYAVSVLLAVPLNAAVIEGPVSLNYGTNHLPGFNGGDFELVDKNSNSFTTFCLEITEYFWPTNNKIYDVDSIAGFAENGGEDHSDDGEANKDYLSNATKWLMNEYINNYDNLYGKSNSIFIEGVTVSSSFDFSKLVQEAIWYFEDETSDKDDSTVGSNAITKYVIDDLQLANWDNYSEAYLSNVMVVNLSYTDLGENTTLKQSQVFATAPVPEPATMLLFGTGLAGLAGISRRRKK